MDLVQIYKYICMDSVYYAVKTVNEIIAKTSGLTLFPNMGRKVQEYNLFQIRELIYKSYRIIYEVQANKIIVHRIWHSARKLPQKLIF